MWFYALCALATLLGWILLTQEEPKPIFGVYHQRGRWYWLKYYVFLAMYYYRKLSHKNRAAEGDTVTGQGVVAVTRPEDMERAQMLSDDVKAFDAVFFISAKEGENGEGVYVQAGCERRPMGICNGIFYLAVPGKGLLYNKKQPDTMLFGAVPGQFGAEGLLISPVEPMKRWTVTFEGEMRYERDPTKVSQVKFHGAWRARGRHFDYDTDLHPPAVARSIAIQPWSREYFHNLKTAHQSHYEQFGVLDADFTIDGEKFQMELPSFRDHSFGHKRDWSLMHRYIFHHIFIEDGTSMCVGVICQPSTTSFFEAGAIITHDNRVLPVEWCDLQMYQHGEGGEPPKEYAFRLGADGHTYTVQVFVEHQHTHYKGWEWESRLVERFCRYVVDGRAGRGTSEWQYAHRGGRPADVASNDPEWYRKYCHEP